MEQKSISLGFKKVRWAHKATAGDTGINLTSLVQPTEMATYGFVNPNVSELSRAQINLFRNNLKLVSSIRGLLVDQLSYVVASATQINFIDFTAEDGEIFTGWLDEAPTTSLSVVDGQNIVASGILLAGQTDFNIGTPIEINKNPSQQIGAVMVFADRGLQYRKVGNVTGGDGDYIEVPVAGGLGSLIRFNASAEDRFITVVSNGIVAERPDGSMMAAIERVQGQVDQMVPTLAAVAGVPESTFQTGPNSVDLKQFGDTVLAVQPQIDALDTRLDTLEQRLPSGYQALKASVTTSVFHNFSGAGVVLTPGYYRVTGQAGYERQSGASGISFFYAYWSDENGNDTVSGPNSLFSNVNIVQTVPIAYNAVNKIAYNTPTQQDASYAEQTIYIKVLSDTTVYIAAALTHSGGVFSIYQHVAAYKIRDL